MSEQELKNIADHSEMIISGYAFTRDNGNIRILNLNNPAKAMVISSDGKMLETNMDPIEQTIVKKHWSQNACFMEDADA